MALTYQKANESLVEYLNTALQNYHPHLSAAGVRVDVLCVYSSGKNPPITEKGVPALARIKVTSLKERALGLGDALILVDAEHVERMPDGRIAAIFDHELCHLQLVPDERDDLDRPKLKTAPHDLVIEGFLSVARRHGSASIEAQQAIYLVQNRERRQALLPGFELTPEEVSTEDAYDDDDGDELPEDMKHAIQL